MHSSLEEIDRSLRGPYDLAKAVPNTRQRFGVWKKDPRNSSLLIGNDEATIERRWVFCQFTVQAASQILQSGDGKSLLIDGSMPNLMLQSLELAAYQSSPRHSLYVNTWQAVFGAFATLYNLVADVDESSEKYLLGIQADRILDPLSPHIASCLRKLLFTGDNWIPTVVVPSLRSFLGYICWPRKFSTSRSSSVGDECCALVAEIFMKFDFRVDPTLGRLVAMCPEALSLLVQRVTKRKNEPSPAITRSQSTIVGYSTEQLLRRTLEVAHYDAVSLENHLGALSTVVFFISPIEHDASEFRKALAKTGYISEIAAFAARVENDEPKLVTVPHGPVPMFWLELAPQGNFFSSTKLVDEVVDSGLLERTACWLALVAKHPSNKDEPPAKVIDTLTNFIRSLSSNSRPQTFIEAARQISGSLHAFTNDAKTPPTALKLWVKLDAEVLAMFKNSKWSSSESSDVDVPVCASKSCGRAWGIDGSVVSVCSGCKRVVYCGRACQRKHWKVHKPKCTPPSTTS